MNTRRFCPCIFLAAMLPLARGQQNTDELNVNVRSGVELATRSRQERTAAEAGPAKERGTYVIAFVRPQPMAEKLVQPVEAAVIAESLNLQLKAQGFRRAEPTAKPDMVIGVEYGRGYVSRAIYSNLLKGEPAVVDSLSDTSLFAKESGSFSRLEEKMQRMGAERLVIQVVAWKYPPPPNPKEKLHPLWRTILSVDDPDHRDLNVVAAKMLEAGAPYFDREMRGSDVEVSRPLPEGRVKIGTPEEVRAGKSAL